MQVYNDNCLIVMSSTAGREIMDVLYANQPASRNFAQNFEYGGRLITHEHHVEVETTGERLGSLEIRNHFATLQGQTLLKLTEIHFENRIIKIIDTFAAPQQSSPVESQQALSEVSKTSNRRQLLSKRFLGGPTASTHPIEPRLRDTKNVVKNIIRLFQGWLDEIPRTRRQLASAIEDLVNNGKYNNNLIISLAALPPARRAFLQFCRTTGRDYISRSKINDKTSHLEALEKYETLCIEREEDDMEIREARERRQSLGQRQTQGEVKEEEREGQLCGEG